MRRFRNHIAFILIAASVTLVTVSYYLYVLSDPVQRNAPERTGTKVTGMPVDFELSLQTPFSTYQHDVRFLNHFLLALNLFICGLVGVVALYVVWRYRRRCNPYPSARTQNPPLEVFWTMGPAILLVVIAIPSFRLLHVYNAVPQAELTLKAIGHQWYWEYQYPDNGGISIQSVIVPDGQLTPHDKAKRLLATDQSAVLPINTAVRIQVTAADVIHSFFIPSLGVQKYAIPGRLNETWTRIEREGVYYGQCNQICGANHAFMPIAIRALSKADFDAWVRAQRGPEPAREKKPEPEATAPPAKEKPELEATASPAKEKPAGPPATTGPQQKQLSGNDALGLAALVAQYSPLVPKSSKKALSNLFDGKRNFKFPAKEAISIEASSINCRKSSAAIAAFACGLEFAGKPVPVQGRRAHELLATLAEAGTASHQEAGMLHYNIDHLKCEVRPGEILRGAGSGSECRFDLAQP